MVDCLLIVILYHQEVHEEHRFVKGEEECSCSFILFWRHGPKAGSLTAQSLDTICRVQPRTNKMHPLLNSFLKTAREKIETTLSNISTIPREVAYDAKTCTPNYRHKLSLSLSINKASLFSVYVFLFGLSFLCRVLCI